jgi:CBS domain-containing protein
MTMDAARIMTRRTITARPDSTVAEVAGLLSQHDISAVPVCADDGTLLGIISEGDLLRPFREEHSLRRAWWLGVLSAGEPMAHALARYLQQDHRHAEDLMTRTVISASETLAPEDIAKLLLRHNIKRVPITRNGLLVGLVSRADLIRALARQKSSVDDQDWHPNSAGSDNPAPEV